MTQPDLTDEILRDYVLGRADDDLAARVEAEAARHPAIAAELAMIAATRDAFREDDLREAAPGELAWVRLNRALDAESARTPQTTGKAGTGALLRYGGIAAAAILVWQIAAVPLLRRAEDPAGYVPVTDTTARHVVAVAFAPDVTDAELLDLLRELGARVVDGPSALGLWRLGFDDATARDAALDTLSASAAVEAAYPE